MNLTNLEKLELFRLIANKVKNKRYKLDEEVLVRIGNKLANEILDKDYIPKEDTK